MDDGDRLARRRPPVLGLPAFALLLDMTLSLRSALLLFGLFVTQTYPAAMRLQRRRCGRQR
jgi:hypothetical protein